METAEKLLQDFIAKNPNDNAKVLLNLVSLNMSKGNLKEAVAIYEKVVANQPTASNYLQIFINVLFLCSKCTEFDFFV